MDQHNIDRLFREKLDDFEITPSAKSWSEVEKRIGKKNKPMVYWIAASITLFVIAWSVWPDRDPAFVGIASQEIDHPALVNEFEMGIPVAADIPVVRNQKAVKRVTKPKVQLVAMEKPEVTSKEVPEEVNIIQEIEEKATFVAEETNTLPSEVVEETTEKVEAIEPNFSAVKITYIASNTANVEREAMKNDSTGVLKKFIAFTEKLDPGEMLADIKTAKDNLLSSGFKSKKDRAVMTP